MRFHQNFQTNYCPFVIQGKKTLFWTDYKLDTFIWRIPFSIKRIGPCCVTCGTVITINYILIECADLVQIRKKYFQERYLYSLLRNIIPEAIFDFLREIGVFCKIWSVVEYFVCKVFWKRVVTLMWNVLWLVEWKTRRWVEVCFQPWCNPLWLTWLKAPTD